MSPIKNSSIGSKLGSTKLRFTATLRQTLKTNHNIELLSSLFPAISADNSCRFKEITNYKHKL